MASFIASKGGFAPLLAFVTCCLWVTFAHPANDVLSSDYSVSSSSSDGIIIDPSDYEIIIDPLELSYLDKSSSSSSDMSSSDESTDPPHVSSDCLYLSAASSSSSSADVGGSPYTPPNPIDELFSDFSSSSSLSSSLSSESDSAETEDIDDPPYVPPSDYSSSSSDVYPQSLEKKAVKSGSGTAGSTKRGPASLGLDRQPGDASSDSNAKRKPGRPPAVFNDPRKDGPKPVRGGRPGKQWGGPPSPQRLKELREADKEYLDLYLCGQFFTETADDFAVVTFNYAGRTQPFSPCSELDSTPDTINYIYRAARDDKSALQQVVDDLPATWERYVAEKGAAPRIVHIFTVNMPASVVDISELIQLRGSESFGPARFVLGYLNQPASGDGATTNSAREFLELLSQLSQARIHPLRVCGRCAKVSSYPAGGRRRRDMQFGMSVVSKASTDVQCRPVQEHTIPGIDLTVNTCDSFQKAIARCTLRSIERRCRATGIDTDSDETDLLSAVNELTMACAGESDCWRREGESIRQRIAPESQNRCKMPDVAVSKMLGRCAAAAANLPFDIEFSGPVDLN